LHGSAGSRPVFIVVCQVSQRAEFGRESVSPAEMKLCPGLRNPFASKQTTIALQKFVFWWQEKVKSPTSKQKIKLSKVRTKCKTLDK